MSLADEVETMVWAFGDESRKAQVRELAKRVAHVEAEEERYRNALYRLVAELPHKKVCNIVLTTGGGCTCWVRKYRLECERRPFP